MGKFKFRMLLRCSYRDGGLSTEPIKHRKISTTSTETQAAGITVALGPGRRALLEARNYGQSLQPRDHSAWRARPHKWIKGYICFGTLGWYS